MVDLTANLAQISISIVSLAPRPASLAAGTYAVVQETSLGDKVSQPMAFGFNPPLPARWLELDRMSTLGIVERGLRNYAM